MRRVGVLLGALAVVAAGCGGGSSSGSDTCDDGDGALSDVAFVLVTSPQSGERVSSGFTVTGCSRTFESNVPWKLLDSSGTELASGATMGGGADGPGPFSFTVTYTTSERQIAALEVSEEDVSGGEGARKPVRNVVPLVLRP